ncbi:MAG: AMP-binding protein [Pseudomonadota bacterium]
MGNERLLRPGEDWGAFVWSVPERFNIAVACCDVWPGDRVAIVVPGGVDWTFGDLRERSDRLASAFAARGIGRGDRVAILLPQDPVVMLTHFAAMKLGAVTVPLFTLFGEDALRYRLEDSGARACVTDAAGAERLAALDCQALEQVYVAGDAVAPHLSIDDEIARAAPLERVVDTAADDPAMLIYTSGTTGAPKGALHAHRFLLGHLPSVEAQHEYLPQPGDIGWTPADWAWIGGLMDLAMPCLFHGLPLVAHRMGKFDPDAAFRLIRDEGVRNLFLPPTALKLMRQAEVPEGLRVRSVASGGESLGADLHDWAGKVLRAPVNEIYGQTEANLVITTCHAAMDLHPGSMGRAAPGHEVAVLGPDDAPMTGEIGEICVRTPDPVMFLGYWNRPEATAEKVRNGWLRTGDLGTCDADGYFTFVSRDDDVITSAGYRIGPTEIEACLNGDPDVVNAGVVGLPDPVRTEAVTAFVVAREGANAETLEARLQKRARDRVGPYAAPRRYVFVDTLPLTATGKVMRRRLREAGSEEP